jgi:hypothetical protein
VSDQLDRFVQLGLPASRDVDKRAFFNKAPGGLQPNAPIATRDNGDLAIQSQHYLPPI